MLKSNAVFLHGFWRTGSTWLWNSFRKLNNTYCYYEPYHKSLSDLNKSTMKYFSSDKWNSRHNTQFPYFREYKDLICPTGGVDGYDPRLSVDFFFADGKLEQIDQAYLKGLICHAVSKRKIPIFGFCRSLGRAGALGRIFGGTHLVLLREPFSVLGSVLDAGMLGDYLELLSVPRNQRVLSDWGLPLSNFKLSSLDGMDPFEWVRMHPYTSSMLCLHIYLAGCFAGLLYADEVVELERVSEDPGYRKSMEGYVINATGLALDLSDCSVSRRFDPIRYHSVALDPLLDDLEAFFSRPNELAERVALAQGIDPKNDPEEQMLILRRLFSKSLKRFSEHKLYAGENIARTESDILHCLEGFQMFEDELVRIERTLSWRLTHPFRALAFRLRRK